MTTQEITEASGYWFPDDDATQRGVAVLNALRRYRASETAMRRRTRDSMGMGETDLLAVRHLLQAQRAGRSVSPKDLSAYLKISSASTTILVDRLVRAVTSGASRTRPTDAGSSSCPPSRPTPRCAPRSASCTAA